MKTRVIINPAAGGGRAGRQWSQHEAELRDAIGWFEPVFSTSEQNATALAAEAAKDCGRVIAVGGDGTVNEVVNGLAAVATSPEFGVIGVGTGNDFARALGIGSGWSHGIDALRDGKPRSIDLGLIRFTRPDGKRGQHWFANAADLGLIGEVVADAEKSRLKRWLGSKLAYPLHAVVVLSRYKGHRIAIEQDGGRREIDILAVAVANGRSFGGGMKIAPHAEFDDGLLDVIVVAKKPKVRASDLRLLYAGTHLNHPAVSHFRTAKVRFETVDGSTMLCDADGELLGTAPCEIEVVRDKLRVIAP